MARPPKKGIDYSGWSVSIFDNDTKIDKLLDAQGWTGFGIYFYLCQRAYGGEGYFYQWCYDDCASTSRKMGGGIGAGTVKETVDYCLQIGLFDKGLFDRWGVLTSRGIQRRYWEVVKGRDVRSVISDYWLLRDDECKGLLKTPLTPNFPERNPNFPERNPSFPERNPSFPGIKESKLNKSKVKQRERLRRIEDFISAYPKACNRYLTETAYCDLIMDDAETEDRLVQCAVNYAEACRVLETPERYIKNAENFLKEFVFEKYLPGKYEKPIRKNNAAPGSFNDFQQRDYDFNELEKMLLEDSQN